MPRVTASSHHQLQTKPPSCIRLTRQEPSVSCSNGKIQSLPLSPAYLTLVSRTHWGQSLRLCHLRVMVPISFSSSPQGIHCVCTVLHTSLGASHTQESSLAREDMERKGEEIKVIRLKCARLFGTLGSLQCLYRLKQPLSVCPGQWLDTVLGNQL